MRAFEKLRERLRGLLRTCLEVYLNLSPEDREELITIIDEFRAGLKNGDKS